MKSMPLIKPLMVSLAAAALVAAFLEFAPATVAGQTQTASATGTATPAKAPAVARAPAKGALAAKEDGAAIKTPWGEPDLQGIWTDEGYAPLERPAKYAGREFFTEEERVQIDDIRSKRRGYDYRATRGTTADVGGAYNEVYHLSRHVGKRTSVIVDPPNGRMPARTPEVEKREAAFREFQNAVVQGTPACRDNPNCGTPSPRYEEAAPIYATTGVNRSSNPEDHGLIVRCLAGYVPAGGNAPGFSDPFYLDLLRIVQTPGGITIWYDLGQGQGFQRNIVMDGRPHLPPTVRQWWGDSRGRWEGNTLVIDVTNFSAKTDFLGSRENLHVVERFTRTGPKTIDHTVTLEDPTAWVRPWTANRELTKQDEYANRIYTDNRCQEGNYGLPALLRGARLLDKAFADGKGPNPATICAAGCGPSNPEDRETVEDAFK